MTELVAPADRAGIADFADRLLRLDRAALVRLRPHPPGAWAMLPFRVLVCRTLRVAPESDITIAAAELTAPPAEPAGPAERAERAERAGPAASRRRDAQWRWPLPSAEGRAVESIPEAEVVRLASAAARTVRAAATEGVGGRAVGERALRDALLDHVAIVITTDEGERVDVPQRMVQGLVRAGLVGVTADTIGSGQVTVRLAMGWVGLETRYGSAWYRPISPLRLG